MRTNRGDGGSGSHPKHLLVARDILARNLPPPRSCCTRRECKRVQSLRSLSDCRIGAKQTSPRTAPRGSEWQMVIVVGPSPARLQPARGLGARHCLGCCFLCPFRSDFIGQTWIWVSLGFAERDGTIPAFPLYSQSTSPFWLFAFPGSPAFSLPCWLERKHKN